MRIMGIDPGLATMGWGVIDCSSDAPDFVASGIIQTSPEDTLPRRLTQIDTGVEELLSLYEPGAIVFEQLFFAKNVTTAFTVGAARGVAIARCARYTQALYEYTPMQIKQAVVGYGKAEKQQVQRMIQLILKLPEIIRPDDAADAVAAALTHFQSGRFGGLHIMK
ncbi:MAG: crossover junction endodeoxyribonuclease RuvC [Clostridiales bacterium]|nr:crossover junction endodeoxyribonuclease RuvC [Clostridiales bacterium]